MVSGGCYKELELREILLEEEKTHKERQNPEYGDFVPPLERWLSPRQGCCGIPETPFTPSCDRAPTTATAPLRRAEEQKLGARQ